MSYIKISEANSLRLNILPNNQLALLVDRKTRMASLGEVDIVVQPNGINLRLRALVMEDLQTNCFGGTTFHVDNGIETRIMEGTVKIHSKFVVQQHNQHDHLPAFPPHDQLASPAS